MSSLRITCSEMRAALAALLLLTTPALADSDCRFYNEAGQSVTWTGGDTLVFDPLYRDAASCTLSANHGTNGFTADCGSWKQTFVPGSSTMAKKDADIVVFGEIFYWLACVRDRA